MGRKKSIILSSSSYNNLREVKSQLIKDSKKRAKERNLEHNITIETLVLPVKCPIFKTPFRIGSEYTYSLDRINNTKGYTVDNVKVISKKANQVKSNMSYSEIVLFCKNIKKYMNYGRNI